MPQKRYRVIKNSEVSKPLQARAVNVKVPTVESILKSSKPSYSQTSRSNVSPPRKQSKRVKKHDLKAKNRRSSTIFSSDDVELKLVSQNCFRNTSVSKRNPERLTENEEENSLKIEDFDQPPQSTSTPILGSSSYNSFQDLTSPHAPNAPYQMSPLLYSCNPVVHQYPYCYPQPYVYSQAMFTNDSPLQKKAYQDHYKLSRNYVHPTAGFPQYRTQENKDVHPQIQMSYPLMSGYDNARVQYTTTEPIFLPMIEPNPRNLVGRDFSDSELQRHASQVNYLNAKRHVSSGNSSYKSSGGDATYQGSAKS